MTAALVIMASLLLPLGLVPVAGAQDNFQNITSYRTSGAVNFAHPGSESVWANIPWTEVPLVASVQPGGGHTDSVLVKSFNDGYSITLLFRWNDSQGPSYLSENELYTAPNGTLVPLTPDATAGIKQLYYNSTYYYPDRVAMLWYTGNSSSQQNSPKMVLGSDGALTGGSADIWHWQSNPTDNNANDSGFPGGYTDPAGKPIYPPDNLSFAEDDYTNMTGFYVIAGSFGQGAPNLDQYANPFAVLAGNQYNYTTHTWTVEMTRSFTTDASSYRVQLATNSTYYVAFAVWNGKMGESADFKSVSQWYSFTVSDLAPSVPPVPAQTYGVTPLLAAAVGAGAGVVGVVIGVALRNRVEEPTG